jgi:hypothetical protein
MVRVIQILFIVLLLALASGINAQTPMTCGIADIEGPSEIEPGMPLFFKAKLTGMSHTTKPEFRWSVSAGTIPPVCDPVGIPLSEIKFTKPRPKSSKRGR